MDRIEIPSLMEPLLPPDGTRVLEDLAIELVARAASLAGKFSTETIASISTLVRSMNCYYSNLIEGSNTHPVDIERALRGEYSSDVKKRNLQREAFAHIEVQSLIDDPKNRFADVTSADFIKYLHGEFCKKLPEDLLKNKDPKTGLEIRFSPGELRTGEVLVGSHLAPVAAELPNFLGLFEQRYKPENLSALMRVIAVAASHHRLLWIHPFFDGNGRVTRLFSHAFLKEIGIGSGLWSISRGLARNVNEYKERLAAADSWRENDTDGRGNLSLRGLVDFCAFFLSICIDQIKFMEALLEPSALIERVRIYCNEQIEAKKLHRGSFELLREILLSGSIPRSQVGRITGYKDRQCRKISSTLIERGLVVSPSTKADLALNIPHEVVEAWFPKLYPPELDIKSSERGA
jgi:Fic family protein